MNDYYNQKPDEKAIKKELLMIEKAMKKEGVAAIKAKALLVKEAIKAGLKAEKDSQKKALKELKESRQPKKYYVDAAQKSFNIYIRARDSKDGCISCGKMEASCFHAGHYVDTTYSLLRFNEDNTNKQCSTCNMFQHGNLINYRKGLMKKIGKERLDYLEFYMEDSNHIYSIEDLILIKEEYDLKTKAIKL